MKLLISSFLLFTSCILCSCRQEPQTPATALPPQTTLPTAAENYRDITTPLDNECTLRVRVPVDIQNSPENLWQYKCGESWLLLGNSLGAMIQTTAILPSPDFRFLAVESVGEGHPVIEVIDLQALLKQKQWNVLFTVNPFPGTASVKQWNTQGLVINSNMKLDTLLDTLNEHHLLDVNANYILGIDNGKLEKQ